MLTRFADDLLLLALVTVVALAMMLAGCSGGGVVVVHRPPPDDPDADVIYIDDQANIAEIDAARTLTFSGERTDHLRRIAQRPRPRPGCPGSPRRCPPSTC